ncbi:MAG: hypothetical protein L0Y66_06630 [Myxococcaceae bacterium]|nr:hypothetical protein [Myxococcaceae bacterium]MCI0673216.1 hypothetical protein [Myxococcaceae bacterium]
MSDSQSLTTLLADGVIDAILGQLKTGKEAEVWLVQHAEQVVAAKVYKERHARNFKNNAGYREGREVRNSRTRRAMEKGTRFGQAAAEEAWKSAEADALYALHAQGVRVPTPVMFYEGVLLMEVVVDATGHPAPRLVEAPPTSPEEAHALYVDLRAQVVRMLSADLIHGDLSPYNILMGWAGPVVIDFPQTVGAARNNRAEFYFRRDLDNVRDFLAAYDPRLHGAAGDTGEIWNAYVRRDLTADFVPSGNFREAPKRNGAPGREGGRGPREAFGVPRERLDGPRDGSAGPRSSGPRAERGPGEERRNGLRPERPAREDAAPASAAGAQSLSAEEAELRELEATFLRQGGGERGKPPPSQGARDGRRRPFNARGPQSRGGPGRPPAQGAPRDANGARPAQQGGPRDANGARPAQQGGQRQSNDARPAQQGGQRQSSGTRPAQQGGPRDANGSRPEQQRGQRDANVARPAQQGGPRETNGARPPQQLGPRDAGAPQPRQSTPRGPKNERRPLIEQRGGGRSPSAQSAPRGTGTERGPIIERRGNGPVQLPGSADGRPLRDAPRRQASAPQVSYVARIPRPGTQGSES